MNLAEMLEELRKEALADPKLEKKTSGDKERKSPAECFLQPLQGTGISHL